MKTATQKLAWFTVLALVTQTTWAFDIDECKGCIEGGGVFCRVGVDSSDNSVCFENGDFCIEWELFDSKPLTTVNECESDKFAADKELPTWAALLIFFSFVGCCAAGIGGCVWCCCRINQTPPSQPIPNPNYPAFSGVVVSTKPPEEAPASAFPNTTTSTTTNSIAEQPASAFPTESGAPLYSTTTSTTLSEPGAPAHSTTTNGFEPSPVTEPYAIDETELPPGQNPDYESSRGWSNEIPVQPSISEQMMSDLTKT